MKAFYFISSKILRGNKNEYSRNIVGISVATIAVGVAVMIMAIFILNGFKHTIEKKVIGFLGDARIVSFTENESLELPPVSISKNNLNKLYDYQNIVSLNSYASKAGIIKTSNIIEGVVLYGIGQDYDQKSFSGKIIQGYFPKYKDNITNDSVIISKTIANKLFIQLNDKITMYFVNDETPRIRRFIVAGIYESGFNDYDKLYVFGDINQIRKLNLWEDNQVGGYQVFLKSKKYTDDFIKYAYNFLDYKYIIKSYRELNPQVFDWLRLQDINVILLVILMSIVCIITMISIMIIVIIEKTSMIGILKALGMNNKEIRKIFLVKSLYLTGIGILVGNVIILFASYLQQNYGVLKLSQESYYMNTVPVEISIPYMIVIDVIVLILCVISMTIAATIITKIKTIVAIQSE